MTFTPSQPGMLTSFRRSIDVDLYRFLAKKASFVKLREYIYVVDMLLLAKFRTYVRV